MFPNPARGKGTNYFLQKRVFLSCPKPNLLKATVRGSSPYTVQILMTPPTEHLSSRIIVGCTCPHFMEGNYCKHLWAAILKAESEKLAWKLDGPVEVVDALEDDSDKFWEVESEEEFPKDEDIEDLVELKRPVKALFWKMGFRISRREDHRPQGPCGPLPKRSRLSYFSLEPQSWRFGFESHSRGLLLHP